MDRAKILEMIENSPGIGGVEEIEYKPGFLVVRLFYDYDEDELEAARNYADSECSAGDDEDVWYDEYYIPYIIDLAVDEVRDTLEDMVENMALNIEYINYKPDRDDDSCEFIAVIAPEDTEFDIDEILDAIEEE